MTSTVKVLKANDICRGSFRRGSRCCFIGWLLHWFSDSDNYYEARKIARQIIGTVQIINWSDNPRRSRAEIACAINKVTAKLGYKEGNPEA